MRRSPLSPLIVAWCAGMWALMGCAPVAVTEGEKQQQEEEEERYRVRISYDPAVPQAIQGFVHLGRVSSVTMGSAGAVMGAGSPRDLDAILDAVNELTALRAGFTSSLTYSDPRLFGLPIIIPQSAPNEVEMEQLTRYLLDGGFVMNLGLGFEIYREGLEKYGNLMWGQDAWIEPLDSEHPVFSSFFEIGEGMPQTGQPGILQGQPERMPGLFIHGRLAGVHFPVPGAQADTRFVGQAPGRQLSKEEIEARYERSNDFRRQQLAVNIVVYALTQEGSIGRRLMLGE